MSSVVSKRKLPANRKEYLRLLAQARKERSRRLISLYLVYTADWLMKLPHIHGVRYDTRSGMISFSYLGAAMQYYVGSEKLLVQHSSKKTVLTDVRAQRLILALIQGISIEGTIKRLNIHPLEQA